MNNDIELLQQVINTLQIVDIKSTYDNLSHMLGSIQTLMEIRDRMQERENSRMRETK